MARAFKKSNFNSLQSEEQSSALLSGALYSIGAAGAAASPLFAELNPTMLAALSALPAFAFFNSGRTLSKQMWLEKERSSEIRTPKRKASPRSTSSTRLF